MGERGDSQVSAHDDVEVAPLGDHGVETACVVEGLLGGVYGARADDDDETVVLASEDAGSVIASEGDGVLGGVGRDDLVAE